MANKKAIKLNWFNTLEEGLEQSKNTGRPVMVYFTGSDWCTWCIGMSELCINNQCFVEYAEKNLILVKIDFLKYVKMTDERKKYCYDTFYDFGLTGLPTVLLLDNDAVVLGITNFQHDLYGMDFVKEIAGIIEAGQLDYSALPV